MGYYSEVDAEMREPQKNPRLADLLGITYDELNQLEYECTPETRHGEFTYSYCIEVDMENSPKDIVDKIANLENGIVYVNAIELDGDDYEEEDDDGHIEYKTFGKTVVTETGIKYSFLATVRKHDFCELWRLLGKEEKDYKFDILYHIGTKDVSDDDYNDFCAAYIQALRISENEDFAQKSPIYNNYQKYFIRTINKSVHKVNMCIIMDELDLSNNKN
jgi:hypothetical protein